MASVEDGITAQIRNIESEYGKPITAWIELVSLSGLTKHNEIVAMLKSEHGMRHGGAHRVGLLAREAASPSPVGAAALDTTLYSGKRAALRPVHDALVAAIDRFGTESSKYRKRAISASAVASSSP